VALCNATAYANLRIVDVVKINNFVFVIWSDCLTTKTNRANNLQFDLHQPINIWHNYLDFFHLGHLCLVLIGSRIDFAAGNKWYEGPVPVAHWSTGSSFWLVGQSLAPLLTQWVVFDNVHNDEIHQWSIDSSSLGRTLVFTDHPNPNSFASYDRL